MNIGKLGCIITVLMILLVSFVPTLRVGGLPIEEKGMPEYYDRYDEPETFSDLFFPRIYEESSFNLTVPPHLKNTYLGLDYQYAGDQHLPDNTDYSNITLHDDRGEKIINRKGFGGGGANVTRLGNTTWINYQVRTVESVQFMLFETMEWDGLFQRKQSVEFKGAARSYNLYGIDKRIEGFDRDEAFIRIHLKSDKPLRYYLFESSGAMTRSETGNLVDHVEDPTVETTLDLRNDDNPMRVGSCPYLVFANPGGSNETANVEFSLEVLDYPAGWSLPLILISGTIFVAIIGGMVWKYKKEDY